MAYLKNTEFYDYFLENKEKLNDVSFLEKTIIEKIGYRVSKRQLNIAEEVTNEFGGHKLKQYPNELAKYLCFLYSHASEINSYFEIGVERGGTFFVVDSFLRALNPNFKHSFGIDIMDKITCRGLELYSYKFGCQVTFKEINSHDLEMTHNFDLTFIDADHSYHGALYDYSKFRPHTNKYVAFHDIKMDMWGVDKLWDDLSGNKWEFLNEDARFPVPVGIGLLGI